jgi:hypothetical protein
MNAMGSQAMTTARRIGDIELLRGLAVSECNFRLVEAPLRRRGMAAAQRWTASA